MDTSQGLGPDQALAQVTLLPVLGPAQVAGAPAPLRLSPRSPVPPVSRRKALISVPQTASLMLISHFCLVRTEQYLNLSHPGNSCPLLSQPTAPQLPLSFGSESRGMPRLSLLPSQVEPHPSSSSGCRGDASGLPPMGPPFWAGWALSPAPSTFRR